MGKGGGQDRDPEMPNFTISTEHVSKRFGHVQAVTDMSFQVEEGQIVGLLGPNGAGKTTTLRMITGYLPPTEGRVLVCGHDTIAESIRARRRLGYLPESVPLYPEMRVRDYLKYRAGLYSMSRGDRRAGIARVLQRCWLTDVEGRRIGQLSKGYRQRVGLAGAMLHDPEVLILDEPTSGLDPAQIRETRSLIRELAHQRTVIVSSHILPEVERTCDRVLIIARGKLRADGSPAELVAPLRTAAPYRVEVQATAVGAASEKLAKLPGVASVAVEQTGAGEGDWARLKLSPNGTATDLRASISRVAAESGLLLRELTRETPTLEQVFLRVIEAE
jgi:ABC-2 type transport system ATP-binding protein